MRLRLLCSASHRPNTHNQREMRGIRVVSGSEPTPLVCAGLGGRGWRRLWDQECGQECGRLLHRSSIAPVSSFTITSVSSMSAARPRRAPTISPCSALDGTPRQLKCELMLAFVVLVCFVQCSFFAQDLQISLTEVVSMSINNQKQHLVNPLIKIDQLGNLLSTIHLSDRIR